MEWRGSRSKNTVFQTVIETQTPVKDGGQLVEKVRFLFCASCDSTHKIEFAQQIHKNRGRGPDHPLLPLCGNSPCVPRFLYKGRKNVSGGRGFSSAFDRKRGFDREAARKTIVFRQPQRRLFTVSFLRFVLANHRIERFQRIRKRADLINQSECGGLIAGDHGADIGGQLTGFAHKLL